MTAEELRIWQYDYAAVIMGGAQRNEVDGVHFSTFCRSISYRHGKATGLVFADNFYCGLNNFEPGCRLSPRYSDECRYCILCKPDLASIAAAVKESWAKFIS